MSMRGSETETLLTPAEVAALFRVDPKTVTRWAKAGKLSSIRTESGNRSGDPWESRKANWAHLVVRSGSATGCAGGEARDAPI
jgi:hypothetical protein